MSKFRSQPLALLVLGCLAPNCGHIGIEPHERASGGSGGAGNDSGAGGAQPVGGNHSVGGTPDGSGGRTPGGGSGNANAGGGSQTGGASNLGGAGGMGGELGLGGAPSPPRPCSEGDFGPLEMITGLSVDRDKWAPSVTADGLLLVFAGSNAESESIYQATRPSRDEPFGPAIRLMNLEHSSHQGTPFISADGRRLYYAIEGDEGPSGRDLWSTSRAERDDLYFGTRNPITTLNSSSRDHLPWLTFDEETIYFTTSRNTQAWLSEIWTATRTSVDTLVFSDLTVVNTERIDSEDASPTLTPDGLTMYFTSDRSGEFDVWSVQRSSRSAPFESARREPQLSEQGEEINISLSPDGREMFLSSTGDTRQELFIAKRNCPD